METSHETILRQSPGLDQFVASIRNQFGLFILDLAGATQANISFITDLHHRVYSDDFVKALDVAFGDGDFFANQSDPVRVERFMTQTLDFPERHFGGALVWDTLAVPVAGTAAGHGGPHLRDPAAERVDAGVLPLG